MAYLALYRRYRPVDFDGVIGQTHIVRTLRNQIKTNRIGHAYLFSGARGTGKTSTAKIFARAINCLEPINGSPCGKCEACKALSSGNNLDILEMDAASNNKVENVREIREKIQYPPVAGRYKVYIIDEVHMLTSEAFNALLKTLEEPPEHAVFILATTEAHKLPATILSRCMRFDFRLIPTKEIVGLVKSIYDDIGKSYDDEAIYAIARAGGGCVRDALSIADICVSYKDGTLSYGDVLDVLGATDSGSITALVEAIISSNAGVALETVERLVEGGKNVGVLTKDLITRVREMIICKSCKNSKEILELPEDIYENVKSACEKASEERLLRVVEIFSEAEAALKYSTAPRIVLETAVVRASMPDSDYNIDALLSRITALENALKGGIISPAPEEKREIKEEKKAEEADYSTSSQATFFSPEPIEPVEPRKDIAEEKAEEKKTVKERIEEPSKPVAMSAGKIWGTVIRKLRADGNMFLWVACQEMRASLKGRTLIAYSKDESSYSAITKEGNLSALSSAVKSVGDYDIEIAMDTEEEDGAEQDLDKVRSLFGDDKVKVID